MCVFQPVAIENSDIFRGHSEVSLNIKNFNTNIAVRIKKLGYNLI